MLAAKRSAGVAPKVNLREHVTRMPPPSSNKAAHFGFENQGRHHQKSETGISVAPKKGLMSSKIKKKFEGLCSVMQLFMSSPYLVSILRGDWLH